MMRSAIVFGSNKRRPLRRHQRGVMLIEVLVSILIFSFGLLGAVAMQIRAVQYSANAEDRNRAALFANEIASTMLLTGTVALPTAVTANWNTRVGAAGTGLPGGVGDIAVDATGRTATIRVRWTPTFSGGVGQRFETQVTM